MSTCWSEEQTATVVLEKTILDNAAFHALQCWIPQTLTLYLILLASAFPLAKRITELQDQNLFFFTVPKPILLFIRWSWSKLTALSNKRSWMTGSILFYVDFPELHNQERYHVSWGTKHLCYQVVQVNSHLLNPITHLPSPHLNPINCAPLLKMGKIEKEFNHLRSHWIWSKIMCTL